MTPSTGVILGPGHVEVDRAVRSVLGEMFGPRDAESRDVEEVFGGSLLSLRQAEALAFGTRGRVVRIAPGTVVTPLARDHLKRLGIEVRRASRSDADRSRPEGGWGFAIETNRGAGLVEALRRGWLGGDESWRELAPGLDAAIGWVVEAPERGALVLTDEGSTAVYRACRTDGVRAAVASEVEAVVRARRALEMNVLVVEPLGKPIGLIRQLASAFRREGAPGSWRRGVQP